MRIFLCSRCDTCFGRGMVVCVTCEGTCQLKCYICLTIMWKNRPVDHIVERTPLPDHLIRGAAGQIAFEETQGRVGNSKHTLNYIVFIFYLQNCNWLKTSMKYEFILQLH